jgi:hypothetical protein
VSGDGDVADLSGLDCGHAGGSSSVVGRSDVIGGWPTSPPPPAPGR